MNKSTLIKPAVLIAALAMAVSWATVRAQNSDSKRTGGQGTQPSSRYSSTTTTTTGDTQVRKINKVSSLIGMNIKNTTGDTVGEIKDIVVDFGSDKIAYVVFNTATGVLSSDKLHAVPLKAFQPTPDGTGLTLNVDKDKLANSEGFSKDSWPSPSNPSWGAQPFWDKEGTTPGLPRSTTPRNTNPDGSPK